MNNFLEAHKHNGRIASGICKGQQIIKWNKHNIHKLFCINTLHEHNVTHSLVLEVLKLNIAIQKNICMSQKDEKK